MHTYTLDLDKKHGLPRQAAAVLRSDDGGRALRLDYTLGTWSRLGVNARVTDEAAASVLVQLPGVSVSARVEHRLLGRLGEREIGASLDWTEGLWAHWSPAVRGERTADLGTLVFGPQQQSREVVATYRAELMLPERPYPCVVSILRVTLWRERAPELTRRTFHAAEIRYAVEPPFPGKGESAHDLEDDGISRSYRPFVSTVGEALAEELRQVMRYREQRASWRWKPEALPVIKRPPVVEIPAVVQRDVETASRWFALTGSFGVQFQAFVHNGVALLVVKCDQLPDVSDLTRVLGDRLRAIACAIPGEIEERHVAFVSQGRVVEVAKGHTPVGEAYALIPFDLEIWRGSPAVFC